MPEVDPGPMGPLEWAYAHRRIDGRPFSLARFTPLAALYADPHPHIVVIKPAQRGVSEYAINYTGFALDRGAAVWTGGEKEGLNVAYIFPKKEALGDFSKERLSGLMSESTYLEAMFGDDDYNAVTFKQVGGSYLYLRGGWSTSALKSFPADVLILDEFDEMATQAVALARRRLNASLVHRELDISTPSVPMRGIHAMYMQSDRQIYEQQHGCGAWVRYDFLRDIRVDGQVYDVWQQWPAETMRTVPVWLACPACDGVVSDAERLSIGRWRAEAPGVVGLRGYWIPPLAFPVVDLVRLVVNAVNPDPSEREEFFRSDLGYPYSVGGTRITSAMLYQLSAGLPGGKLGPGPWRDTTMGVDVGARWHVRVSATNPEGYRVVRWMGTVHAYEDLDGLMATYRVRACVIDALPELEATTRWAKRYPGRVLRAYYPTGSHALKTQMFAVNRDKGSIDINRTMALDHLYAIVARAEELWPSEVTNDPEVQAHLTAPIRTVTTDASGQQAATWIHSGPDHLYHAASYDRIAFESLPLAANFQAASGGSRTGFEQQTPGQPQLVRRGMLAGRAGALRLALAAYGRLGDPTDARALARALPAPGTFRGRRRA